jgi:chaperone LolA
MKNKAVCSVFLLLVLLSSGQAQTADQILNRVRQKYNACKEVCADFVQTFHWKLANETQVFKGNVCTRNGAMFRVESQDQTIVTDGKTIWTMNISTKQIMIDNADDDAEGNPFLKSYLDNYIKNYSSTLAAEEPCQGKPSWHLHLTARSENQFAHDIDVWVDKATSYIMKIEQVDANGNTSVYEVSALRINPALPDRTFTLAVPEGYEVIDMR